MEIIFNPDERKEADAFLKQKLLSPQNYIYINIGASGAHRRWPENRFFELAEKILEQTEYKIILEAGREKNNTSMTCGKNSTPIAATIPSGSR